MGFAVAEDQEFTLPPLEERPLVTFALFAYNQEKYIREAVEGAFAQTYEPLEIILSDDCSTDSTFLIMQQMADEYEGPHTVRVVRNAFNMGVLKHVFERGRDVQGSIIVMAAGDDISFAHRTERLVGALLRNPNADAVYSSLHLIDKHGQVIDSNVVRPHSSSLPPLYLKPEPPNEKIIQGCSAAYRKYLFQISLPPGNPHLSEDVLFSFIININHRDIIFLEIALLHYRSHEEAISNRPLANQKSSIEEEELNMLNTVKRIESRINFFKLLSNKKEERINHKLICSELRRCTLIKSWNELSTAQRFSRLLCEIIFHKGRLAKWQTARLLGKFPHYQPKAFFAKFQTDRYRQTPPNKNFI